MSTSKELNNWIEQQLNGISLNAVINEQAKAGQENNSVKIELLHKENTLIGNSIVLRKQQDLDIAESIKLYKKMIRNGEYGDENKNMVFIDE